MMRAQAIAILHEIEKFVRFIARGRFGVGVVLSRAAVRRAPGDARDGAALFFKNCCETRSFRNN
ncbi:hypothetical protein [Methylocapsa aurea]|uniref:hypothetical protein n=1 Tax=Methylocapsa aurea TaxID=663610 RepID=UPI003D18DEF7